MLDNSSSNDNIPKPSQPPIWPRWTKEEMDKVLSEKPVPDGPFWIWDYGIEFQDKLNTARLYPLKLLQHLLTREVLSQEVRAIEGVNDPDKVVEQVLGSEALAGDTYIKIFAILKMIHKLSKLQCFIEAGVSDQKLVLSCDESQNYALSYGGSKTPVPSDLLEPFERKSFSMEQFNMHLPFFSNQTAVQDLSWTKVLPYYTIKQKKDDSEEDRFGAYGSVSKIVIHPLCHDFDRELDILEASQMGPQLPMSPEILTECAAYRCQVRIDSSH